MAAPRAVWLLPLANAFDWTLEAGRLQKRDVVVIVGPEQHGLACVVAARQADAGTIVLVGTPADGERLALGANLGADHTITATSDSTVGQVRAALNGGAADLIVNTSGAGPELLDTLIKLAGKRARVVESGLARGRAPDFDLETVTARALSVVGARGRSPAAIDRAIDSLDTGGQPHPLDALPTSELGLEHVDAVLRPADATTPARRCTTRHPPLVHRHRRHGRQGRCGTRLTNPIGSCLLRPLAGPTVCHLRGPRNRRRFGIRAPTHATCRL
ncbi:MAG: zinc-binding dehydrogenase [Deltaproteobacteria bacterium]|nr:zinc-binding dehydrogenase [Deltaproteobacteria bacterium]MPZ93252.1 zinc-binding dehydrogenase [Actinomycetota bacterium]